MLWVRINRCKSFSNKSLRAPNGKPSCRKWSPKRLFSFTWKVDPKIDSKETSTLVEFRLEKTASGTLLLLTESGFDKIPGRGPEAFRRNDGGWTEQMKNIEPDSFRAGSADYGVAVTKTCAKAKSLC
jgi:hypothetical protein